MDEVTTVRRDLLDRMITARASAHELGFTIPKEWDGSGRCHVPEPHEFDGAIESATHLLQELCCIRSLAAIVHMAGDQ